MKKRMTSLAWIILGLAVACFLPVSTHAQAETTPDQYKESNAAPHNTPAPIKPDFQGHFKLAVEVQCHGHKLVPGEYTLMVKTVGQDKMVTLQREGSDVVIQSHPIVPTTVPDEGHSAVLVRHGPGPSGHTLEGVYVENLKLVLMLDESGHVKFLDKVFGGIKRVPIT